MSVIGAVEPTLRKAEVERARRKRPDSLDAYDLFLRALPVRGDGDAGRCRQSAAFAGGGDPAGAGLCHRPWIHRLVP